MKFADFKDGMLIKAGPVTITEAEILEFARKFDPQWFHTDVQRAAEGRWGCLLYTSQASARQASTKK